MQRQTNISSDQNVSYLQPNFVFTLIPCYQQISCNVSAKFTTSPRNVWSKSKAVREPFFAGLQVVLFISLLQDVCFCYTACYVTTPASEMIGSKAGSRDEFFSRVNKQPNRTNPFYKKRNEKKIKSRCFLENCFRDLKAIIICIVEIIGVMSEPKSPSTASVPIQLKKELKKAS